VKQKQTNQKKKKGMLMEFIIYNHNFKLITNYFNETLPDQQKILLDKLKFYA